MKRDFLEIAKEDKSVSLLSEVKIIELLQRYKKAVMLSSDSLENIQKAHQSIINAVMNQKTAMFVHYHVNNDYTIVDSILSESSITDAKMMNIAQKIAGDGYKGYIFVVDCELQYLFFNGQLREDIESILMRARTAKKQYDDLYPVSKLSIVLDHFLIDCKHGVFYDDCFRHDGIIRCTIRERELRNILINYLRGKMQGEVPPEFCTDMEEDEESVDIGLYDGKETAIIEVKYAFDNKYYAGKTRYKLTDRAIKGYEQLNKYAIHLSKDGRRVEYGYLYVFHITSKTETEIQVEVASVFESLKDRLSPEFISIYTETVYNDMHKWKAQRQ